MDELKPKVPCIFINEYCEESTGKQAAAFLKTKAMKESTFFDPQRGVVKVDRERWEEAQRYERRTWMEKCKDMVSDHNESNKHRLGNYSLLKGLYFKKAIELGCGPFTNMRFILDCIEVKKIYLLDPLINDFIYHPYCRYRKGRIGGLFKDWPRFHEIEKPVDLIKRKNLAYRNGGLFGRHVNLIESTIESFKTDLRFDLIIMINVLEHCQDADAVFEKILGIMSPGGIIVYGDNMFDAEEVRRLSSILYDAGHPLRVASSVVESFFDNNFTTFMKAYYPVVLDCHGIDLNFTGYYYIGKLKPF
jgi:SAM-dependent methyltransferase